MTAIEVVATVNGVPGNPPARVRIGGREAAIGDRFAARNGGGMVATVFCFSNDGERAYVRRNTSRRRQAIRTRRLLDGRSYDPRGHGRL